MAIVFDCIIIGGGPAGSTTAYHLAKKGRSVLLLDRAQFPRYKPCSGGVSPAIARWFDFDLSPTISQQVKRINYTWKMGDPVEIELENPMWMVKRDVFDHYLIQQAQKEGVILQENTRATGVKLEKNEWTVTTDHEEFVGRYLIGADGAGGAVSKWLGFKQPKEHTSFVLEASGSGGDVARFEFGTLKSGYIWAFPKADGYSISIASFLGEGKDLKTLLINCATQWGINVNHDQLYQHPLYLWDGDRPLHKSKVLLVGDTAGLTDPLLGEGIRPSILSGVRAAEAVDRALNGEEKALEEYTKIIHEEWGADMVWAQRLASLFYRFPGVGYKAAVKLPIATQLMAKILSGELRYHDVAGTAIKRLSGNFFGGKG